MNFKEEKLEMLHFFDAEAVFQNVFPTLSRDVPTFRYSFFLRFVEQSTEPVIQP